ncbi:MAG: ferredoxin--NADP reductase [Rhodobacteraceae bacterium]|nr:ferredoxin--NADP reductase [Paracoccaceae bacterium]
MNDLSKLRTGADTKAARLPDAQIVTSVHHWNERLFSFRVTRPQSLRFRSGEFLMIGLMDDNDRPLLRAYSIASPNWAEELEFYSIKVPDGPLTSRLQHIKPGDQIIIRPKPVGSLVIDALLPGKRLYLIATGTGVAPFASLVRDPEVYEKFDQVILTHTTRSSSALDFSRDLVADILADETLSEIAGGKLWYYPTTTREETVKMGRITDKITSGELFRDLEVPPFDPAVDRVMICGSMGLNLDMKAILEAAGLREGANSEPGEYVLEKAFVG